MIFAVMKRSFRDFAESLANSISPRAQRLRSERCLILLKENSFEPFGSFFDQIHILAAADYWEQFDSGQISFGFAGFDAFSRGGLAGFRESLLAFL